LKGLARRADQNGKWDGIPMCKIVSKDAIWYTEFVLGELGPAIILSPRTGYDAGDNPPYIRVN
jgi:hypothetical protein